MIGDDRKWDRMGRIKMKLGRKLEGPVDIHLSMTSKRNNSDN